MKQARQPAIAPSTLNRRKLLGAAGTTGTVAAAATVLATHDEEPTAGPGAQTAAAPAKGGGYRLSEHVMRYYQTAKV
ncbi:MAG: formate dehydrogenase [Rubrivivax sp.]|nr:formate dehydrogenase [Rubrivivax sp.]